MKSGSSPSGRTKNPWDRHRGPLLSLSLDGKTGVTGHVTEIIEDGLTGLIVNDDEAAVSVPVAANLDRRAIRWRFESRFTAERIATMRKCALICPNSD